MLYITPTYAIGAEVSFTSGSTKGKDSVFVTSEPLMRVIGGGIQAV